MDSYEDKNWYARCTHLLSLDSPTAYTNIAANSSTAISPSPRRTHIFPSYASSWQDAANIFVKRKKCQVIDSDIEERQYVNLSVSFHQMIIVNGMTLHNSLFHHFQHLKSFLSSFCSPVFVIAPLLLLFGSITIFDCVFWSELNFRFICTERHSKYHCLVGKICYLQLIRWLRAFVTSLDGLNSIFFFVHFRHDRNARFHSTWPYGCMLHAHYTLETLLTSLRLLLA